jgi:hypothetical protein
MRGKLRKKLIEGTNSYKHGKGENVTAKRNPR